jgi:hypothetical protein
MGSAKRQRLAAQRQALPGKDSAVLPSVPPQVAPAGVACAICGVAIPRKALHDGHHLSAWCGTTVVNLGCCPKHTGMVLCQSCARWAAPYLEGLTNVES